MRSLEYLIQLFPDKTGKEIKAIQEQDRLQDEAEERERNAAKIAWMEDINTNGGYFKRSGSHKTIFKCWDVRLLAGALIMKVEKIVVFQGPKYNKGEFTAERTYDNLAVVENYGFDYDPDLIRTTEKEWNEVKTYLENVSKFWE